MARGRLVIVGSGIRIAKQCTVEARYHIESADVVFEVVGDTLAQGFLRSLNANVVSLQHLYGRDRARRRRAPDRGAARTRCSRRATP